MAQRRREGQEGNRWANKPPTPDELTQWFEANVEIDEALNIGDYVGGVTLIPNQEKSKEVVGWNDDNAPNIQDVWNLVFTPYMKVETRVKYFHDLVAAHDWLGFIDPVTPSKQDPRLPPGFFTMATRVQSGEVRFICCSMKVTIFKKEGFEQKRVLADSRQGLYETRRVGTVVKAPPAGTKAVPVLGYNDKADTDALMKAETGAVGRALGMAGILVIPGTGLATAEDMQESEVLRQTTPAAVPEGALLPEDSASDAIATDEALRAEATEIINGMKGLADDRVFTEFSKWAHERGFGKLSEVTSPALRGLVRKAQKMLDEAMVDQVAEQPTTEIPIEDVPAPTEVTDEG
jgi:hypothetical protein